MPDRPDCVPPADLTVRDAEPRDVPAIAAIYNDAILRTVASAWTEPRPEAEIAADLAKATARHPWLVAELGGAVVGVVWAKPWNMRDGYARSIETSVYIGEAARGMGVGRALYEMLLPRARAAGAREVMAGIALPNAASVRLHEGGGFVRVGVFRELYEKFGALHDVGYWQLRM
jgi:L-amino acid N-acyltransferase YncA